MKDVTEQPYKETLKAKEDLIHMVLHELRTSMRSVREILSLILDGVVGEINN